MLIAKYRGREVTQEDVTVIQALIDRNPGASRRALSKLLCEAWDWRQENGHLRDMVCRGLMLKLHRSDHIKLPPVRCRPRNNIVARKKPESVAVDQSPITGLLSQVQPLTIRQVRRLPEERVFDALMQEHHYLSYTRPVGEHLKFLVTSGSRPIACFAFSSAPRHLGPRDRFIGWSKEARLANIRYLAYNTRFLILPWVQVPHLASHLLGRMARTLSKEWEAMYSHPVHYLETFVDPERFRGTCYRAANWIPLGLTQGLGKDAQTKDPNRSLKEVMAYPLTRRFREILSHVG
jgi:Druantia protein DruA